MTRVAPPEGCSLADFLAQTELIDWSPSALTDLARSLRGNAELGREKLGREKLGGGEQQRIATAANCFRWVRDSVQHSSDYQQNPVTCSALEVFEHRTGYCYAKSHLLAALLRANGIPAGFCYQRLSVDESGERFCLHGLNAVFLESQGWYRVDARGDRDDITTDFCPPEEHLAFATDLPGEYDLPHVWPGPLEAVVTALKSHETWDEMLANLPDVE